METIVKLRTNRSEYDIRDSAKYSITVGDFIEILERCPRDSKIVFSNDNDYTFGEIGGSTIRVVEVETFEEEREREEREREEEERTTLHCPYCDSEGIIVGNKGKGRWFCCDCGEYFNEAVVKIADK